MDCARSVKNSETMPQCVWINVRLWRQRHSAVTAGYIVQAADERRNSKCDAVCRTENVILSSNHGNPARDHFCKRKKENGKERNI